MDSYEADTVVLEDELASPPEYPNDTNLDSGRLIEEVAGPQVLMVRASFVSAKLLHAVAMS